MNTERDVASICSFLGFLSSDDNLGHLLLFRCRGSWIAGLLIWLVGHAIAVWVTRKDPEFFLKTGLGASNQFESAAFIRSAPGVDYPDIQFHFLPKAVRYDGKAAAEATRASGIGSAPEAIGRWRFSGCARSFSTSTMSFSR